MEALIAPYSVEDLVAEDPNDNGSLAQLGVADATYFEQGIGEGAIPYVDNEL